MSAWTTRVVPLDAIALLDTLIRSAATLTVAGRQVRVAGLDDLIESKETSGRDQDLRALGELRRLRPDH